MTLTRKNTSWLKLASFRTKSRCSECSNLPSNHWIQEKLSIRRFSTSKQIDYRKGLSRAAASIAEFPLLWRQRPSDVSIPQDIQVIAEDLDKEDKKELETSSQDYLLLTDPLASPSPTINLIDFLEAFIITSIICILSCASMIPLIQSDSLLYKFMHLVQAYFVYEFKRIKT